jgi:hypothetical protein
VLPLLQVPPPGLLVRLVVDPTHTVAVPPIAVGRENTVITFTLLQVGVSM